MYLLTYFPTAGEVEVNYTSVSGTEGANDIMFCMTLVGTSGSPTQLDFQFRVSIGKDTVTAGLAQNLGKISKHTIIEALNYCKILNVIYMAFL